MFPKSTSFYQVGFLNCAACVVTALELEAAAELDVDGRGTNGSVCVAFGRPELEKFPETFAVPLAMSKPSSVRSNIAKAACG